jgi:hypothetical protein
MTRPLNEALRDIVERHGTAVIDDVRRCEACIREAALAKPEIAGLVTALREGIPKRLLRLPAGTLSRAGLETLAAELAHNGGLNEAVAQRSVEAWAYALRLAPSAAAAGQPGIREAKAEPPKVADGQPAVRDAGSAATPAPRRWTAGKIAWLVVFVLLTVGLPLWIFGGAGRQLPWWQIGLAALLWCNAVREIGMTFSRAPPGPKPADRPRP